MTLWFDDGGCDAYRVDGEAADGAPFYNRRVDRFGHRGPLTEAERAGVADGWSLEELGGVVDALLEAADRDAVRP